MSATACFPASSFRQEALKTFASIDTDGDGNISQHELSDLLERVGCRDAIATMEQLFRQADVDGDGMIDFDEFLTAARAVPRRFSSQPDDTSAAETAGSAAMPLDEASCSSPSSSMSSPRSSVTRGAIDDRREQRQQEEEEEEEEREEDLRVAFDLFDRDGSGGICA